MEKKRALIVLIKHSYFFPRKLKIALLKRIMKMSAAEVDSWGRFFAFEQNFAIKNKDVVEKYIKELVKK